MKSRENNAIFLPDKKKGNLSSIFFPLKKWWLMDHLEVSLCKCIRGSLGRNKSASKLTTFTTGTAMCKKTQPYYSSSAEGKKIYWGPT